MSAPIFSNHGCRLNAYETEAMKELAEQAGLKAADRQHLRRHCRGRAQGPPGHPQTAQG